MFAEMFLSLAVAVLMTGVMALVTGRLRNGRALSETLMVLFPATWAGGIWLQPFGPQVWGVPWLPFLLTGVILALILTIGARQSAPRSRRETIDMLDRIKLEKKAEEATYVTLRIVVWSLLVLLGMAIVFRYL